MSEQIFLDEDYNTWIDGIYNGMISGDSVVELLCNGVEIEYQVIE